MTHDEIDTNVDSMFDEDEPNPDDGLFILVILFYFLLLISLIVLSIYTIYDLLFIGTPTIRFLWIIILVGVGLRKIYTQIRSLTRNHTDRS
jgi:hypothetical protein